MPPAPKSPFVISASVTEIPKRAETLDALAAILPFDRRDFLAEILTNDDVETLRHLAKEGMGENSLKALASDLGYLEAWSLCSTGFPLPWPAPEALLIKFIAHHIWDPTKRATDPLHGMPEEIANALRYKGLLRATGPHAPATVQRRLASWSTLTRWRGLQGAFNSPALKSALRLAVRATHRPRQRKSGKAISLDILSALLQTCSTDRLIDLRDKALLLTAFASGGRRRSEIADLRLNQLIDETPISYPDDPHPHPCLKILLGRTKTTVANDDAFVLLIGSPVRALKEWIKQAGIQEGAVFRSIDQWGNLKQRPLTPQSVNAIVKNRIAKAGLDPKAFSAHGLRAGYLTEAARKGIPLPEAMQQSQHRSINQAARYYNDAERKLGKAAQLIL